MTTAGPSPVVDLDRSALLLDVDGTILDIAPTPRQVTVQPSLHRDIAWLSKRAGGALALVSGRSLDDLDRLFAPLRLPAVASHGAEFRPVEGTCIDIPKTAPLDPALKYALMRIGNLGPGILVEDKGYAVAVHFRLAAEMEAAVLAAIDTICAASPTPVEILPGKFVFEVKQTGISKATGVRELMTYPPFANRRPLFIGDDKTDETVFAIIPELRGRAYSVGRVVPGVDGCFAQPKAVRSWLASLVARAEGDAA